MKRNTYSGGRPRQGKQATARHIKRALTDDEADEQRREGQRQRHQRRVHRLRLLLRIQAIRQPWVNAIEYQDNATRRKPQARPNSWCRMWSIQSVRTGSSSPRFGMVSMRNTVSGASIMYTITAISVQTQTKFVLNRTQGWVGIGSNGSKWREGRIDLRETAPLMEAMTRWRGVTAQAHSSRVVGQHATRQEGSKRLERAIRTGHGVVSGIDGEVALVALQPVHGHSRQAADRRVDRA